MKKMRDIVADFTKKIVLNEAKKAAGSTCWGPNYQMKEPQNLKNKV